MKKISTFLFVAVLFAWQNYANAANATVMVGPNNTNTFSPNSVTINVGDMVTWQWVSSVHDVTSDSSPEAWTHVILNSSNTSFSHTFTTAGSYPYHCMIHGVSMAGVISVQNVTGIKDDQLQNRLLVVYPNPAQGQLKIALHQAGSSNLEMKMTNIIGQVVKTVSPESLKVAASKEIELNVADLPAGVYFFTLYRDEKMLDTRRIIIQK